MNTILSLIGMILVAAVAAPMLAAAWQMHGRGLHSRGLAWNALTLAPDAIAPAPGSKAYFALDGDTVETVTVSESAMPAGSSLTAWKELGIIDAATLEIQREGGEPIYDYDTTLGKHVQIATRGELIRLVYNITVQKVTQFINQMARNADGWNNSTGAFTHNDQPEGHYKGYLKISHYQGTSLVSTEQFRAELSLAEALPLHSRTGIKPVLRAVLIDNNNNTAAFGVAS